MLQGMYYNNNTNTTTNNNNMQNIIVIVIDIVIDIAIRRKWGDTEVFFLSAIIIQCSKMASKTWL